LLPGTHTPPQAPPVQALVQVVAGCHCPLELQVCCVVVEAHWVWPGTHTPPQALDTQAKLQVEVLELHCPLVPQV
jgi:hypothetical protein